MEKIQYRNIFRKKRQELGEEKRILYAKKAFDHLEQSPIYKNSQSIFVFVSMGEEIPSRQWIQSQLDKGKEIYIPYTEKKNPQMYMTQIYRLAELEYGPMNILQVPKEIYRQRIREKVDLVLAPGLAFDDMGYRLGYGGGFYDRFLDQENHRHVYGLGFSIQRLPILPHTDYDRKLDGFISERGIEVFPKTICQGPND